MIKDQTLRILKLVDHDAQYRLSCEKSSVEPIILNMYNFSDPDYMETLSEKIFSSSKADGVAKCQCGAVEGNNRVNTVCGICGTKVVISNLLDDDNLICRNWVSSPKELTCGWLSPKIYLNLAHWLSYGKNKFNYLDDILDVDTPIPFELSDVITGKGFLYLYNNFDRIMAYFINDHPVISKKPGTNAVKHTLHLYKDQLFCHYIPILNAAVNPIFITDNGGGSKKRYTDTTADHILSAIVSLSSLEFSQKKNKTITYVERVALRAFRAIISYVEEATKKYVSVKKAIPRNHIFGTRFHLSARTVIVPITKPLRYYELHWPWRMAVNTLRVHIKGVLLRDYKMSINEADMKFQAALQVVDEDIKRIMNKLIEDSPYPGLPVVWDRPPSIRDGSVTLKFVTVIKDDITDGSIAMSPLDVALNTADFDGDNMAAVLLVESEMVKAFKNLSPAALIYNRNTGEVSTEIAVHKTLTITVNHFLGNVGTHQVAA